MFDVWSIDRLLFVRAMKTLFFLFFISGAAQFALANTGVSESLLGQVNLDVIEGLVFGSIHGSFSLMGALFFGVAVILRLKRPGR